MDPTTTEPDLTPPIPQPISPESGHRRLSTTALPLPPEAEQPPCPRCDSTNTKFCYYNNYNLSQPRHFCKSCHRYWTRGGALRKVPVGGGTRKPASSNKRRRVGIPPAATPTVISTDNDNNNKNNLVSCSTSENEATTAQSRCSDPVFSNPDTGLGSGCLNGVAVNLNDDAVGESGSLLGCWWNSTEQVDSGRVLLPFADGYGLGMGCGPDVLEWPPVEQMVLGRGGDSSTDAAVVSAGESGTWQMGGGGGGGGGEGEGGGVAEVSEYFCWPDLAISTPAAKVLK